MSEFDVRVTAVAAASIRAKLKTEHTHDRDAANKRHDEDARQNDLESAGVAHCPPSAGTGGGPSGGTSLGAG